MAASADLIEGWNALEKASNRYIRALDYYRGTAAERFANPRIREMMARNDQSYKFRFAAIPVRVLAQRCRIANVTSDKQPVADRLSEIRQANQATIYEPLVIRKTFMYGDGYMLVWPVEADDNASQVDGEEIDAPAPGAVRSTGVEMAYQSPLHARVLYDAEDGRRPRFAIRRWLEPMALGERWRAEVMYADRIESWTTTLGSDGGTEHDWMPYAEDEQGVEVEAEPGSNWPLYHLWDEIPIKHARTDFPYGEPVHAAAYGPQDAITKAITTQVVVDIEAHGWPERYRLLDDTRMLENGREPVNWGDAATPTAPEARVGAEETARRRGAGIENTYSGTKAVGEFTPPSPADLINPIESWIRYMSVVSSTPLDELDPTVQLSGVSREKADAPLRSKERDAKLYLDAFWTEVYSLAVRMSGIDDPGAISIHWAPPEVTMDTDWWATAKVRLEMGVPIRQILTEANYLPEEVEEWLNTQGEEMALLQRITTLERIGAAIQALGVSVQLGVIDQPTVARLVERVIGEVETGPASG